MEHPYHFWTAQFMPLAFYTLVKKEKEVRVRNCGPMDSWYSLLDNSVVVPQAPGIILRDFMSSSLLRRLLRLDDKILVVRDWDKPTKFYSRKFQKTLATLRSSFGGQEINYRAAIFVERSKYPSFYSSANSEVSRFGPVRRVIANSSEISDLDFGNYEISAWDPTGSEPIEQVRRFSQCNFLIGQYGSGLVNMLWMPKGSIVLEIGASEDIPFDRDVYRHMAAACGHRFVRANVQDNWMGSADLNSLQDAVFLSMSGQEVESLQLMRLLSRWQELRRLLRGISVLLQSFRLRALN